MWNYPYRGLKSRWDTRLVLGFPVRGYICFIGIGSAWVFILFFWKSLLNNPIDPEFQIDSATVVGLKVTASSELSGTWDINLVVTNPNQKVSLNCDSIKVFLYKDYQPYLAMNQLPSFFVDKMNHTRVNFKLGLVSRYIGDQMANKISEEITTRRSVIFGLMMELQFTHRTKVLDRWDTESSGYAKFQCYPIELMFSSNNVTGITFIAQSTACPEV